MYNSRAWKWRPEKRDDRVVQSERMRIAAQEVVGYPVFAVYVSNLEGEIEKNSARRLE